MIDFPLDSDGLCTQLFNRKGINRYKEACLFVQNIPYGRSSSRTDFTTVLNENIGTCSSKHGLLATLAEENDHPEVELIVGIFLMSPETHPVLQTYFENKNITSIPEAHCYLRYKGERFDFTVEASMDKIASKIVREQRIEPHQVGEWKVKIHQDFIEKWMTRNPQLSISLEEIWNHREECIKLFSK